ncbi:MAG TPA: hypothetical protein VL356_13850 [Acidocella sp.]|jgi:hypothetical protein|nr:hypothetical protein [Acidocella sp.]
MNKDSTAFQPIRETPMAARKRLREEAEAAQRQAAEQDAEWQQHVAEERAKIAAAREAEGANRRAWRLNDEVETLAGQVERAKARIEELRADCEDGDPGALKERRNIRVDLVDMEERLADKRAALARAQHQADEEYAEGLVKSRRTMFDRAGALASAMVEHGEIIDTALDLVAASIDRVKRLDAAVHSVIHAHVPADAQWMFDIQMRTIEAAILNRFVKLGVLGQAFAPGGLTDELPNVSAVLRSHVEAVQVQAEEYRNRPVPRITRVCSKKG